MKNNGTREEIHRAAALVGNTHVPNVHQYTSSKIDSDESMSALEINSMNRSPDTNIMWVSPKVNGTPLRMELDTGSVVSVINKQQFDKYFPGKNTIYTSVILKTYSGEEISPLGMVDVDVEYNRQQQKLPLFVVKNGGPPLFGR